MFYPTRLAAYYEISDRPTLHLAEKLDKTKVLHTWVPQNYFRLVTEK